MDAADIAVIYENKVWIEDDIAGDSHVMLQSTAPGSLPACVATVHGHYPYIDNATRHRLSEHIAILLGANQPVERRMRPIAT